MGGPAWQFKKFADACSKLFEPQAWKDKLAAGFTNSASVSGDKSSTITHFWTLAMQMGQIWVGTGLLPASKKSSTPADINWSSGFGGAHAVSPETLRSTKRRASAIWRPPSYWVDALPN